VKDWYITTKEERGVDCIFGKRKVYPAVKYLGNHLWDSIGSLLTKPKEVMDWFQQAASAKAVQNKPLTWMTPTGFKVTQDYRKQVSRKVSTWLHGSLTAVRFRDDTDDIDPRKQSNGASPNIVHSLDASGLVRSVNEGYHRGIADFAVIHDSYATHSTNGDLLAAAIKDSFAELFSQNILADLQSQWEDDGTELLPLPEFGEFDPSEVKNSKYFFS
jgi:DNA-directed RNA polymerase